MTEKRNAVSVSIVIGIIASAVLLLFIFILVSHHRDVPDRVRQQRSAQLSTGSSVAERIRPVGQVVVASAEAQREPVKIAAAPSPASRDGQQIYQAACVVCHGAGIAGAPKLDDKAQWAKRIAKGIDTLYVSAINGVQGSAGVMPPKGGNVALSDAEVKAAVDYIVAHSK
jgi:cytochrome c5